jgi:hypothetical protein
MQAVIFHWFKVLLQNKEIFESLLQIRRILKNPNLFLNWDLIEF